MERIENKLKNEMNASNNMSYPDFDQMWSSIQQDELKIAEVKPIAIRPRRRKKFAMAAALSVALMATPVYAALNYDWSNILSYRAGIQSALEQGLGQKIEQSVTKDGFTLTVHTAFIDDNRTSLLYSLKPDASWVGKNVRFDQVGLKDSNGNFIEGNYLHNWNEELGVFQGLFETDWVAKDQTTNIDFMIENIQFMDVGKQSINYDPNDFNTQVFPIHKDGIDSVTLHSFEHSEGKILLQSTVTFQDPEMQDKGIFIEAINAKDNSIQKSETLSFSPPGAVTGRYLSQQIFNSDVLQAEGTKFQLTYDYIEQTKESTWNLNMDLSKKHLENGSFKQVLDIPVDDEIAVGTKIHEIKVTPTQVRLIFTSKDPYIYMPYRDYHLDVDGTLLKGRLWTDVNGTELRFEMTGLNAAALANQPLTLVAKDRVNEFEGDDQPIRLTNISEKPQSKTSSIAGYPIKWTYFKKDNYLYVESSSSNPTFGGVVQTYYLENNERNPGIPRVMGLFDNNKMMDEYENFDKSDLDIYIWKYTTLQPDAELRVPLTTGK